MLTVTFAHAGRIQELSSHPSVVEPAFVGVFMSFGCALAAVICLIWALLERKERRISQAHNAQLSSACQSLTEHHYRERVQAEERHMLTHDSSMRNVLEHLERALLGKPKS